MEILSALRDEDGGEHRRMKELIDRETAIHRIYNEVSRVSNDGSPDHRTIELWAQLVMDGLFRAVKIVREMEAEELKELHWILCSERLPKEDGYYLVTNSKWGAPWREITLWMTDGWSSNNEPIAWMPLPKPYEEGREEWD